MFMLCEEDYSIFIDLRWILRFACYLELQCLCCVEKPRLRLRGVLRRVWIVMVKLFRLLKLLILGKSVLGPVKIIRPVPFGPSIPMIQLAVSSGPVLMREEMAMLSLDTTHVLVDVLHDDVLHDDVLHVLVEIMNFENMF